MSPCAKYSAKCVTHAASFSPPRGDSERLGRLLRAIHEKCNLSLVRFTKTECAEPNRLFMNPRFTPYQRDLQAQPS